MSRKGFWILLGMGSALRLLFVWRPVLWYDENFTLLISRLSFSRMLEATAGDVHPPLYYLFTWLFARTIPPGMEWLIRIPSVLFSIAGLVVFYKILQVFDGNKRVQITAFALMAINPGLIWYAQEARMYALLSLLVLVGFWAVIRMRWVILIAAGVGMVYTQNYGLYYFAALLLAALVMDPTRKRLATVAWIGGVVGLLYLPWALVMFKQIHTINRIYWIMENGLGSLLFMVYRSFFITSMPYVMDTLGCMLFYAGLALGLITIPKGKHAWLIVIMAFIPVLLAWLTGAILQPVLLYRPLVASVPFLILILVQAVRSINLRKGLILACFAAPLIIAWIPGIYTSSARLKEHAEISLAYIQEHWQAGDIIYHLEDGSWVNWTPYSPALVHYKSPECGVFFGSLSPATRKALGMNIQTLEDIPFQRAWIVYGESPLSPVCEMESMAAYIQGEPLTIIMENEYISSGVWLYEK